jgi:glycosylphosphatidylinositol phospholipase D
MLAASASMALALAAHAPLCAAPGLPATIELSALDGTHGFVLRGVDEEDFTGTSVSGAGDVNGDGFDDIIIGAPDYCYRMFEKGRAYVVFGTSAGFPPVLELASLDGRAGFVIEGGDTHDCLGIAVDAAGDVNDDGIADMIIGAANAPTHYDKDGRAYVVFGTSASFPPVLDLSTLDGANGFRIDPLSPNAYLGSAVSGAGDVNGDHIDDVIIGAWNVRHDGTRGEAYVVFGRDVGFPAMFDLGALDGTNGFVLTAFNDGHAGYSVSAAGDVNGDGLSDLIIGAHSTDLGGYPSVGEAYVVFGSATPFPASSPLSDLDGDNGFTIRGVGPFAFFGSSVSGAGDLNGDGVADVIVGAPNADSDGMDTGQSYVVFGASADFPAVVDVSILNGDNGFALKGSVHNGDLGSAVSGSGDLNGDGVDDVIIGAPKEESNGNAYVVFGSKEGFPEAFYPSEVDGSNGFVLEGGLDIYRAGCDVRGAGDVNGDGVEDVIVGARETSPNQTGEAYVVFGCRTATDGDCDSVADSIDNCLQSANRDQRDTDADGIGNACDADFDQDCMQTFADLGIMKASFFLAGDLDTDMNGDGVTNFVDLGALKRGFFQPPGPSGIPNLCDGG